uniref:Uncharacterized protein n=1 Tax=Babesia bovis TaxID=5865 RepID=S6BHA4_BABBO|nr:conserved hypothetical protein [Babesia bovis]
MVKRSREDACRTKGQDFLLQTSRRNDNGARQSMHPRSRHNIKDDYIALSRAFPVLKRHMKPNPKWKVTMPKHQMYHYDFNHPDAVYHLSRAILNHVYGIKFYLPCGCPHGSCDPYLRTERSDTDCPAFVDDEIPVQRYLAPCVPGRANYIHYLADLLNLSNNSPDTSADSSELKDDASNMKLQNILKGERVKVLDIGTGANCIYPLIGSAEYGWSFIATDIDINALMLAKQNIQLNNMAKTVELRLQKDTLRMFTGVLMPHEFVHLTMCNPPFHSSLDQANLNPRVSTCATINELVFNPGMVATFSIDGFDLQKVNKNKFFVDGQVNYTFSSDASEHGEVAFVEIMLVESRFHAHNALWFTSLVARLSTLKRIKSHIQADMKFYHNSKAKQVAFLNARIEDLNQVCESDQRNDDIFRINVSDLHACEFRAFTLSQGKQTRWVIAWTYSMQPSVIRTKPQ